MEPSPTAEATRFTFPDRASPTTKTPGRLVSSIQGRRERGHGMGGSEFSRSRPVRTNPLLSRDTQPESQSVFGDAPVMTKRCRIGRDVVWPEFLSIHETFSRWPSPSRQVSSFEQCSLIDE